MSILLHIPNYILFEDPYIIVLNKPCGLMVEPDRNGHPNLLHQVRKYLKSTMPKGEVVYAQHIHRLDRPVSGIVLFAKQRSVLRNLSEQFAERKVEKFYQALTAAKPSMEKGVLEHWHRKEKKKAVLSGEALDGHEKAKLEYEIDYLQNNRYLWRITLHTGKFHQIRAQPAAAGCPVIGDVLYGSDVPYQPDSIALHAYKLVFSHPVTNEKMVIEKPGEFN